MATAQHYSTGYDQDSAELKRRNVASYEKTNGNHVVKVEAEDSKKLKKVNCPLLRPLILIRRNISFLACLLTISSSPAS